MPEVIRWETPPPTTRGAGLRPPKPCAYAPAAAELRRHPGVWGVLYEGEPGPASGMASNISTGALRSFRPPGDFEAVSRKRGGVTTVYARYVGDGGQP